MRRGAIILSCLGAAALAVGWHFHCARAFARAIDAAPFALDQGQVAAAQGLKYWPPAMRANLAGLCRDRCDALRRQTKWSASDATDFGRFRWAEIQLCENFPDLAKGDAYLRALRDQVAEMDKHK